ncbi:MAG: SDR family NAD(P)-dependent oxidoreductase [Ignavibacteriaceae bacterium]|jgi:NAD(P)-dependent dehydrogenase (short-subunit alcohol dehydrogenase family)
MARIFITGSADGLGLMAARLLVADGHRVVLHARNPNRAKETLSRVPGAETVIPGDLSSIAETKRVAEQVNTIGLFDAVIHNAGIGSRESKRIQTIDGLSHIFAVNSLAPYILTCLINKPKRLVYISSGLHQRGDLSLKDLNWETRAWDGMSAYADSKLHNVILALAVARKWHGVLSNAMEPGWVPTKMGGPGAPDSLEEGSKTQVWLAAGQDKEALVSGHYFYHKKLKDFNPTASDPNIQEKYLSECTRLSGVSFPV